MTVYGAIGSGRKMAEAVDHFNQTMVERWRAQSPDETDWEEVEEAVRGTAVEAFERERDQEREVFEEATRLQPDPESFDLAELPEDLARRFIRREVRPVMTLLDAKAFVPGQTRPLELGVLRLHVSQIAGWWLIGPEGRATHPQ